MCTPSVFSLFFGYFDVENGFFMMRNNIFAVGIRILGL